MDRDQLVRGGSGTPRSADRHAARDSKFDNAVLGAAAACGRRLSALSRAVRTMGESPLDHRFTVSRRSDRRADLSLPWHDAGGHRRRYADRSWFSVAAAIADAAGFGALGPRHAVARGIVDIQIGRASCRE